MGGAAEPLRRKVPGHVSAAWAWGEAVEQVLSRRMHCLQLAKAGGSTAMPRVLLSLHCPPPAFPTRRSRNCCKRRFGWLLEHTEPQTTCLFDDQGQPAVDFLGRVENLDEDMQARCC